MKPPLVQQLQLESVPSWLSLLQAIIFLQNPTVLHSGQIGKLNGNVVGITPSVYFKSLMGHQFLQSLQEWGTAFNLIFFFKLRSSGGFSFTFPTIITLIPYVREST